jgi:hypothetical protein
MSLAEEDRRVYVDKKDLENFSLKIEIKLNEIMNKMITKDDVEEIVHKSVSSHEVDCPMKHKDFLIKDQAYDEWCKCKKMYDKENIQEKNAKMEYLKNIGALLGAGAGGAGILKLMELF